MENAQGQLCVIVRAKLFGGDMATTRLHWLIQRDPDVLLVEAYMHAPRLMTADRGFTVHLCHSKEQAVQDAQTSALKGESKSGLSHDVR